MRLQSLWRALVLAPFAFALGACSSPPPPRMVASPRGDGVPANSASEERLAEGSRTAAAPAAPREDATQPLTTPVQAEPTASERKGAGKARPVSPKEPGGAARGGARIGKAECKQLFDRYIELTVGGDARFADLPPELLAELKETALVQARAEKGDPCSTEDVSRAQFACAMSASSTAAWERCLK